MGSPFEADSTTTPSSSPKVQESLYNLFRDLSPLKSAQKYRQRLTFSNFSIPAAVFTSPRIHSRGMGDPKSLEIKVADSQVFIQSDNILRSEKEELTYSPSQYIHTNSTNLCTHQENHMPDILNSSFGSREDINNVGGSDMFLGPGFDTQCHDQYVTQSVEAYNHSGQSSRSSVGGTSQGSDQRHCGVSRHLHFGATMVCKVTSNETQDFANSRSPAALPNDEIMVPHCVEQNGTSSSWQASSHEHAATFLTTFGCHSPSNVSTQDSVHDGSSCLPSGFDLPLRIIARSLSPMSDLSVNKLASNQNAQQERQPCDQNQSSTRDLGSIPNSSASRDIYNRLEDYQEENQPNTIVGSSNYSIINMQPPSDSIFLMPCQQQLVPYEGRTLTSPNTNVFTDLNNSSPKRNRKRLKQISDSDRCKRCNCKRSQCLKLYCECFAAGVYCLDSCACENCFNRPDYEDTVLDTRQQIEARNPLAFAPKVVKPLTSSPANTVEERSWATPSSARHKRGCNCKKSKCLKKYCECYQAGVGCSTGCRCEDCNNIFGRKSESTYRRAEKWESPSHEQMDFEAEEEFIKAGRAHQFSSKWEKFPGVSHLSPLSHHHFSGPGAAEEHSEGSQAHEGVNLQPSTVYCGSQYSPNSLAPKSHARKVLSELNFNNMLNDDAKPGILKDTSTASRVVQGNSPNKKRVLSPRVCSQDSRSSRKLDLPAVPSFPSLDNDIGVSQS